jgi:hypothetical protein
MKRFFSFWRRDVDPAPPPWELSVQQHRELLELLSDIGLRIVDQANGPVPLLTFGRRMLDRLQTSRGSSVPLANFSDALKRIIREMEHDRLRVMSPTDFLGVGYVYNAQNPETWPMRSSH